MNLTFPDTALLSCSAALVPWIGTLAAKATVWLAGLLVVGSLMARRQAPLRHLMGTVGLASLTLLPLLSLTVSWDRTPGDGSVVPALALPAAGFDLPTLLVAVWGTVAGLLLGWLALDIALLWWHLHRGATPLDMPRASELARQVGIRRPVRVLQTDAFDIPCTWGLRRPVILLPRQADGWSAEQLDAVLLHELGHVRRLDGLFVILARIACALYWFHPLAWWVHRRSREDAERACDLLVVEHGVAPARYARHLLEIVRAAQDPPSVLAPTMASPSHMARRIIELTELTPASARVGRLAAMSVLSALLISTVLLAAAAVPGAPSPYEEAAACSDAGLPMGSSPESPDPSWEQQQSVEPEPFTPMEEF
jgi:hypothetical protein